MDWKIPAFQVLGYSKAKYISITRSSIFFVNIVRKPQMSIFHSFFFLSILIGSLCGRLETVCHIEQCNDKDIHGLTLMVSLGCFSLWRTIIASNHCASASSPDKTEPGCRYENWNASRAVGTCLSNLPIKKIVKKRKKPKGGGLGGG